MNLGGLGPAAVGVALVGSGAAAALAARRRSRVATAALAVAFAALSVAVVRLAAALVTVDGSFVYVADHASRAMRWPYRLAALWGGMAGSILLWTWMAAGWALIAAVAVRRRLPWLLRGVQTVLALYLLVFSGLLVLVSRPFDRLAVPAIDGGGLNPVLLHPAMLFHPLLVYAGAVGLVVPFAIAAAALAARQTAGPWVRPAVRSATVSLVLLTAGLLAGAHWAYVELGWGGYWAWDPVENGGLLAWLGAVAFLHAGVVARRRAGPATTAAALAAVAFALGLLGAFLTRSGVTESVHAFAEARTVGWVLGAALVATVAVAGVLVAGDRRRSPRRSPAPPLSGKGAVAANTLLLLALVGVIAFGALYPVVARWVTGDRVVLTGRYFTLVATPVAVALLVLLGVGPRLEWRRATPAGEVRARLRPALAGVPAAVVAGVWFAERRPVVILLVGTAAAAAALTIAEWRRRGRGTWPLAHLGVAVLLAGVAGTTTGAHVTATLAPGEQVTVRGWTLRLVDVVPVAVPTGERAAGARLELTRGGRRLGTLDAEALLTATGQRVSVAALRSTPAADVQVALRAVGEQGDVVVEVGVLPLVQLVWWGGLLVVAGLTLTALRPRRDQPAAPAAPVLVPAAQRPPARYVVQAR